MLKRSGRKQKLRKNLYALLSAAIVLPLAVYAAYSGAPGLEEATQRAALLSAMVNMPEGSLSLLESRFADKLDPAYYHGKEAEVAPYVAPLPEEEPAPDGGETRPAAPPGEAAPNAPEGGSPARTGDPSAPKDTRHTVPDAYRGTLLQENMAGGGTDLIAYGKGFLRNYTEVPDGEVSAIMNEGLNIRLEDTSEPQVLIFHTHATESYEPYDTASYDLRNDWRSTDNAQNMVAVGDALAKELRDAGIGVVHDATQHDYPSYNGAYERSAKTIQGWLDRYPTIKIALDVHRDAIQRADDLIVKPVVEVNGKKAAQLMIITGSDDGTMGVPEWRQNLRFAASVQDAIERDYPMLTRPIFFCYRKYNMDKTPGSLLFEVGSNANTLEESVYTARLVGKSIAKLLTGGQPAPEEAPGKGPDGNT